MGFLSPDFYPNLIDLCERLQTGRDASGGTVRAWSALDRPVRFHAKIAAESSISSDENGRPVMLTAYRLTTEADLSGLLAGDRIASAGRTYYLAGVMPRSAVSRIATAHLTDTQPE